MYVCMYVYMCVCMYICMHGSMYVCMYVCILTGRTLSKFIKERASCYEFIELGHICLRTYTTGNNNDVMRHFSDRQPFQNNCFEVYLLYQARQIDDLAFCRVEGKTDRKVDCSIDL